MTDKMQIGENLPDKFQPVIEDLIDAFRKAVTEALLQHDNPLDRCAELGRIAELVRTLCRTARSDILISPSKSANLRLDQRLKIIRDPLSTLVGSGQYSIAALAKKIGIVPSSLSEFLNGKRGFKPKTLELITSWLKRQDEDKRKTEVKSVS